MRIGKIKRLRIAYAFWKALGAEKRNVVFAVVHECGFANITAGYLPIDVVKTMEMDSARGYDHGQGKG